MPKARAIAIPLSPMQSAMFSIKHYLQDVTELLYGTKERTRGTLLVAYLMLILGMLMQNTAYAGPMACIKNSIPF